MSSTRPLFAWANPAFFAGSAWDHTWVTTYDNRTSPYATIGAVTSAGEEYWYCWGSFTCARQYVYSSGRVTGFDGRGSRACALHLFAKCSVQRPPSRLRHNLYLWRRWRLPSTRQPGSMVDREINGRSVDSPLGAWVWCEYLHFSVRTVVKQQRGKNDWRVVASHQAPAAQGLARW